MKIEIELKCPKCLSANIKKNSHKCNKKQNYLCKTCGRQFIGDHTLKYKGCHSDINQKVRLMLVRGVGIRGISEIEGISIRKVLSVLVNSAVSIQAKSSHYDKIEIDEFWTYVGKKKNKVWLIYAYHRSTGEIISYVWGKRNYKTANKLRNQLREQNISYDVVYTDKWDSFQKAFQDDNLKIGKDNTMGIEGNNCRFRHRIRRAFRKTCCFSKKLYNHLKAFDLAFFYINWGYI